MLLGAPHSFENCDDETLVMLIQSKDSDSDLAFEIMCARYMGIISSISSKYRYCAQDYELSDFMQEGLIGLHNACKSFDKNGGMAFKNYAMLCVENRFRSILRQQNKKSQLSHMNIMPLDETHSDIEDSNALSMQELIESKEYIRSVFSKIEGTLSSLEKRVLMLYLSGYTYRQTATALSVSEKAIDNALYRIRKKLSR